MYVDCRCPVCYTKINEQRFFLFKFQLKISKNVLLYPRLYRTNSVTLLSCQKLPNEPKVLRCNI